VKVLLAIDSSKGSQSALDEAVARPWPAKSEFMILTVVERSFSRFPALLKDTKREAKKLVDAAAEKFIAAGHNCSSEVCVGAPRSAIADFAKQWNADFVILGSHGHGAIARFLLGSVAQGVLRSASCSVEIVRPSASNSPASSRALKILLPTDGSEFSAAAEQSTAIRPWPAGSQVKVLSVEEIPVFENQTTAFPIATVYPASLLDELIEAARQHAQEAAEAATKILAGSRLKMAANHLTAVGDPRVIILEYAQDWPADLIVLGSHGRRGFDRLLLGSVSEAVATHAKCSVEVVRPLRPETFGKTK
jgi:nucleotide-binding universal stress UspA family protein